VHLEPFAEGKSLIHFLDPRVKILGLLPFIIVVAIAKEIIVPSFSLILGIGFILLSRLHIRLILSRLCVVNIFILFLWLILPFTTPGEKFFSIGRLIASSEGILYVFSITLKANAIILSTIALIGTIPLFKLSHALRHLRVPEKLVHLFFFTYRYITVLHRDYFLLHNAMKVRGFVPATTIRTYKSYAYLIGMLFVKSYDRSKRIYQAMLLRGFHGSFPILYHFKIKRKDCFFLIFMFFVTVLLIVIETGRLL